MRPDMCDGCRTWVEHGAPPYPEPDEECTGCDFMDSECPDCGIDSALCDCDTLDLDDEEDDFDA